MRVLFSTEPAAGLYNHLPVLRALAERGDEVTVAVHGELGPDAAILEGLARELPGLTVERALPAGRSRRRELTAAVRSSLDYLAFLDDRFNDTYRARSRRRAPRWVRALTPVLRRRPPRLVATRALQLVERLIPADPEVMRYLASRAPDVVLLTPYVGLRTVQVHYLRAAQALGLRTAICVKSWDNLTSKSALRPVPDRVVVWNETQRREAEELHGVSPERVVVTGAQCFDYLLTATPRSRTEFAELAGFDAELPVVLYVCCAPWTGQSEAPFVRRWLEAIRACPDELVARAAVLVRPHPKRPDDLTADRLADLGPVAVWPAHGVPPLDGPSQQDYVDSLFHSAAVVGLNTSAMLESALLRKPVLTVLDPEYRTVQGGTLHFAYLRDVAGGLLDVADSPAEHARRLGAALRGESGAAERADRFARAFLRPFGLDVPATPRFVAAVVDLAAGG